MSERLGLLGMAMGTPGSLEEVESFYTRIRGNAVAPALVANLRARYAAIGGRSPLLEITRAQTAGVARHLAAKLGAPVRPYVGMRFAAPFIADAVAALRADGLRRVVALPFAPHPSPATTEAYLAAARRAIDELDDGIDFVAAPGWHLHAGFIACLATRVASALAGLEDDAPVLFTAHSLPRRLVDAGDPYPGAVRATAEAVARAAGLDRFHLAWQSASPTGEPWLGPDVVEALDALARDGARAVVLCPAGFVADHLEVLYDVDILYREAARALGITLHRTASLNDDPAFCEALADAIARGIGVTA